MWICPYCGNKEGMIFEDEQMSGMLCLSPDCGRVDLRDPKELRIDDEYWAESDF